MSGRVHQEDETKLKATVKLAAGNEIEVTQDTAADLKATVTQAAKDRVISGALDSSSPEADDSSISTGAVREAQIALLYGYDSTMSHAWQRLHTDTIGKLQTSPFQTTPANLKTEVHQDTATDLKATVTQLAKDRTITGTATVTQIPLSTTLGSAITLTNADTVYKLPAAEQAGRSILVIYNISDTTVYIGGSGVATTDGMPLASTKYMVIPASANVYAVCGVATKTLRLLECK